MEGFDTVRMLARRKHDEACAVVGGKRSALELLDGATALTGIVRHPVPDDDPVLSGAEAVLDSSVDGSSTRRASVQKKRPSTRRTSSVITF